MFVHLQTVGIAEVADRSSFTAWSRMAVQVAHKAPIVSAVPFLYHTPLQMLEDPSPQSGPTAGLAVGATATLPHPPLPFSRRLNRAGEGVSAE